MSIYKGTTLLAGSSISIPLLTSVWQDHKINDISWLCADTFSWQSGLVYTAVYNHLVNELGTIGYTTWYAWEGLGLDDTIVYTTSSTPRIFDKVYSYSNGVFTQFDIIIDIATDYISLSNYTTYRFYRSIHSDITAQDDTTSSGAVRTTETVGSYTITYWLATDGHKICLSDQETTVANIHNESGVAWYYILDTENTRFKLPRTKYGFTGLRDTAGKYVPESLPNHDHITHAKGTFSGNYFSNDNQAYSGGGGSYFGTSSSPNSEIRTGNASESNLTYQDNAPVQQRATQMYLYFYVGQFSQTAIEQTAGLNAELFNSKMDIDGKNTTQTSVTFADFEAFKNLILTELSNMLGRIDYENVQKNISKEVGKAAGVANASYTFPQDGYVVFTDIAITTSSCYIKFNNINITANDISAVSTVPLFPTFSQLTPVSAGDNLVLYAPTSSGALSTTPKAAITFTFYPQKQINQGENNA